MSTKLISGEECARDINKCFEFINTGIFNRETTIGKHKNIFGWAYYNKYAKVKENVNIRVYKDTSNQTRTQLLLPPGTHVHLRDKSSDSWGPYGRADFAIVEKIETLEGTEIKSTPSMYDHKFIYTKGEMTPDSDFYGDECFDNPSLSVFEGLKLNKYHRNCSRSPRYTSATSGIHFVLEKKNILHQYQ